VAGIDKTNGREGARSFYFGLARKIGVLAIVRLIWRTLKNI
jgi:hypothetical protein